MPNMKIEKFEIRAMQLSFEPEFHITIEFSYRNDLKIPLKFDGYLFLDRYKFAFLHEYEFGKNSEEWLTGLNSNQNSERRIFKNFIAPISRLSLNKLEEKRIKDTKGDLAFELELNISVLEPKFIVKEIQPRIEGVSYNVPVLNDQTLLNFHVYNFTYPIKINSGDWLHDFSPVFGMGKYQIFELPIPQIIKESGDISKILENAIAALREMETAKLEGEWNRVIKESRPIWELVKNKSKITELLKDNDFNELTIVSFNKLIDSLFEFSSKFIHIQSKTHEIVTINKANKEDAELIYILSISIINLISKKLMRTT